MGNINLNSIVFNQSIKKEDIFEYYTQEQIYSHYIGKEIRILPIKICSPLREDTVPSFGLYYHRDGSGTIMWYDHGLGKSGDCISLVCEMYNMEYYQACCKIIADFELSNFNIPVNNLNKLSKAKKIIQKDPIKIGVKSRKWHKKDAAFWSAYGIKKKTLIEYNVVPIEYVFYNGNPVKADKIAYGYQEFKDGTVSYKIYQPYNKQFKWINNANYTVHQGYRQLPDSGDLLIVTKSLKDVMSLLDVMGISAVAIQSESVMMKESVMDEYKRRFKKVLCLFDNDSPGKRLSKKYSDKYNIPHFFMPEMENVTDFSDLVKAVGIEESKQIFNTCMKNEIK